METQFMNVMEPAPIYDTICICPSLYGNEATAPGWFTSMAGFGAQQEHRFFKNRNQAMVGSAYCNMLSQDRADYAFRAVSIGVSFFGPVTPFERFAGEGATSNPALQTFFLLDLFQHCGLSFRLGQDVRLEASCAHILPGYGPVAGGMTLGQDAQPVIPGSALSLTEAIWVGTQGTPVKENRYVFDKEIDIPRGETFEAKLTLSEYARGILANTAGPGNYQFLHDGGGEQPSEITFPARYGIQCSLWGVREVQQRGASHA